MTVIERKSIPIYEVECFECKSKIHYKKNEVSNCFITCPVCGVSIMTVPLNPVKYEDNGPTDICEKSHCGSNLCPWCGLYGNRKEEKFIMKMKGIGVPVKLSDSNQEPSEWQKAYDKGWSDGYDNGLIDAKESIDSMKINRGGD